MVRLSRFFQRLRQTKPETPQGPSGSASVNSAESISRLVVERLSEDEALRGDLTDRGFGPVLSFVSSLIPSAARRAVEQTETGDPDDDLSRSARAFTRAIVRTAVSGDPSAISNSMSAPLFHPDEITRVAQALTRDIDLGTTPDERALRIVEALRQATREVNG